MWVFDGGNLVQTFFVALLMIHPDEAGPGFVQGLNTYQFYFENADLAGPLMCKRTPLFWVGQSSPLSE